ncbi:MAG: polysaccharide deacetylase family protein [Hyphomonadaceae bacterium]|nr:polysaccharide deacetylase family protein [Hyphomonadaceae bacterium]
MNPAVMKAGLETLYYTGAYRALAPIARGRGIIFMMHQVSRGAPPDFSPNYGLHLSPEFLGAAVKRIRARGFEIVSMDEALVRLASEDAAPFAVLTFDDGYRDNLKLAYPTLKALDCPFTVYVATALPDGSAELWWHAIEDVIATQDDIAFARDGGAERLPCRTIAEKAAAFQTLHEWLWWADEDRQRAFVRDLAQRYGVSLKALCERQAMSWEEVRELAADPIVTIGAHTVGHYALAKLDAARARAEIEDGAKALEAALGARPEHLAYPYGDPRAAGPREFEIAKELGFASAVTTRKGLLFNAHRAHVHALPRVALNGDYQSLRYVDLYLSGAPFAIFNKFRRLNVA